MTASGGCQCGAVRYRVEGIGSASICHCRMCQKAFGNFFAPLFTATGLEWTRGKPKTFASSDAVQRGFCADCGTPLTYGYGKAVEVAIATLDDPKLGAPVKQVNPKDKLPFVDGLCELPTREHDADADAFNARLRSNQHPDYDTDAWEPKR